MQGPEEYCHCIDLTRQDLLRKERPELKAIPENLETYSRIYLGYPNYWGTMPDIRRLGASRGAKVGSGLTANSSSRSEIENWLRENGVL